MLIFFSNLASRIISSLKLYLHKNKQIFFIPLKPFTEGKRKGGEREKERTKNTTTNQINKITKYYFFHNDLA